MADRITEVRRRLADLKSQGKTASTSKEAGKLTEELRSLKSSNSTGSSTGTDVSGGLSNFSNTLQNVVGMTREAMQPAVDTLRSGESDLKKAYQDLVSNIKGEGDIARQQQTLATTRELARRGVLPSTGIGEQEIAKAIAPVQQSTQSALSRAGISEQQQRQQVLNNIANLLSSSGQSGISTALNLTSMGQQQAQFDTQQALQQAQQQLAQKQFEEVTLPQVQPTIENIRSQIANRGNDTGGIFSSSDLAILNTLLGAGQTNGVPNQSPDLSNAIYSSTNQGMIATLPNGQIINLPDDFIPE